MARTVTAADERAKRADVGGIERLVASVLKADDRLGRRRPQTTAALLATLDGRLDAARRLRLARDAWASAVMALVELQRRIRAADRSAAPLDAGPGADPPAVRAVADALTCRWRRASPMLGAS